MSVERDHHVLVFAPIGRDGLASAELFRSSHLEATSCRSLPELVSEMAAGVGAVFLAEEALFGKDTSPLAQWIESQPPWSDLPFVVLTSHREQPAVLAWRRSIVALLRNVSLLERPVQPMTLTSAVQSALRARRRQYEIRALFAAREQAAQELETLVVERTRALAEAVEQLRVEMDERARVEETLRQAQKIEAIGQLTGGVAHDFNNLLMVISGGLDMLDRQTDPDRRRRLMDGMVQAAQRGASLTRQLLAFSRRQTLRPEPVDVASQMGGMRELLDRSLRGDVHVEFDFPDTLWPVEVDPGELELVILNLAVNARDAMPNGGTILVRGENLPDLNDEQIAGDYVRLSVVDTGDRHESGDPVTRFRTILHDQGGRKGLGARACPGPWIRDAVAGDGPHSIGSRPRLQHRTLSAAIAQHSFQGATPDRSQHGAAEEEQSWPHPSGRGR